jgi:hypothetical protein
MRDEFRRWDKVEDPRRPAWTRLYGASIDGIIQRIRAHVMHILVHSQTPDADIRRLYADIVHRREHVLVLPMAIGEYEARGCGITCSVVGNQAMEIRIFGCPVALELIKGSMIDPKGADTHWDIRHKQGRVYAIVHRGAKIVPWVQTRTLADMSREEIMALRPERFAAADVGIHHPVTISHRQQGTVVVRHRGTGAGLSADIKHSSRTWKREQCLHPEVYDAHRGGDPLGTPEERREWVERTPWGEFGRCERDAMDMIVDSAYKAMEGYPRGVITMEDPSGGFEGWTIRALYKAESGDVRATVSQGIADLANGRPLECSLVLQMAANEYGHVVHALPRGTRSTRTCPCCGSTKVEHEYSDKSLRQHFIAGLKAITDPVHRKGLERGIEALRTREPGYRPIICADCYCTGDRDEWSTMVMLGMLEQAVLDHTEPQGDVLEDVYDDDSWNPSWREGY